MKIIYYSSPFYADCDFPLIGELQRKGHDVRYYISIASFSKRSTLIDLKELYPHTGIYPATEIYKEFNEFRNILDLSHVYIVNQKYKQKFHPVNLLLMIKLVIHFMMQKPDVIHLTEPPCLTQKLLYLVKKKLVLTVHDPFRHSGFTNKMAERNRRLAFKNISKLVLLNERQSSSFASYYDVPQNHVFINKLGMYSCIQHIDPLPFLTDRPFILFFGQIVEYKGIEYLLEAMKIVHSHHPELMLVIAGGGKYYFDIEPYKKLDYVKIINRYISTRELAGMLRACEFGVCPYKDATQSGVIQTAFTLEVPMVVTNVGALADAVQHNKTGIVVKPCDVNDLANGIMDLYSNKEKLNAMRKNIKEEWKKDMGWDSIANDYLKCYKNMKILEVVFNLRPGGAERFAVDLTNELSKANDVTIMAIKDDSVEPEQDLFYASELADRVTYKNVGIGKGYSVCKVVKIYKAIKREKADIVHLHGDNMPHYCILAILLLNRKSKFYQTIHSDIHNGYDSLFYRFLVKTVGYQMKMGFIALSETNYCDMIDVYPKIKGACIPNGRAPIVPTDRFDETREEIASYKSAADSRIYLHVARCHPVKNQMLLVEAFGKFVQKGYHADLIIIGPGFENKLGESIRAKAGKNIHFIGTRKNVGDYMLHADAFCLSSDFEGMPITILEASLVGLPIVSTPVCGAVDIIDNKVNGILSKGHTVEEYLDALEYSYKHLSELRQNSLKMKDKSSYTIENCARKYMEFFNR